ncbi:hypothetical protein [Mycobacterium sp.]|uniref:hypothetical protein n=1 Tax=Mycobacterium sp. TaxID=1785 RepID=UPI003F9C40E8
MTFPGTRRPGFHVPPLPTTLPPDPGGSTPDERHHRKLLQAARMYTDHRASISRDVDPAELRDAAGSFATTLVFQQLAPALAEVQQHAADAQANVAKLLKGSRVPEDDAAAQLAAAAFWRRSSAQLDAAKNPLQIASVAQELINSAETPVEIACLTKELPGYLKARQVPSGWLPGALAAKVTGGSEAQAEADRAAKGLAVATRNHQAVVRAVTQNTDIGPLVSPSVADSGPYTDYYSG